uniref:Uncharacterized protein n=1 Tax=Anopheles culicifacies TaxID=139723 RepID=A0A182MQT9_9DIPT
MKGYNTSLAGSMLVAVLLLVTVLPVQTRAGYEMYRQHRQRQQMERQIQMRHHEEQKSEFVKGKIDQAKGWGWKRGEGGRLTGCEAIGCPLRKTPETPQRQHNAD